jgi:tyrosyl-tRNA synthetase
VTRKEQYGGDRLYTSYEELEKEFAEDKMDAMDLKQSLTRELNKLLQPVRDHFANN